MKPQDHTDAWRKNVRTKAQEIQQQLTQVISLLPHAHAHIDTPTFHNHLSTVIAKCESMHTLFGENMAPTTLRELTKSLTRWKDNLTSAQLTIEIARLHTAIGKLDGATEPDDLSFTAIFEKHLKDDTLQQYLHELISELKNLLDVGDDTLTNQTAKELELILRELTNRKQQSLFDIQPWIEFAAATLVATIDACTGTPAATIVSAALVAAKKSYTRVKELSSDAYAEYRRTVNLRSHSKLKGDIRPWLLTAPLDDVTTTTLDPLNVDALTSNTEQKTQPSTDHASRK